MIFYFAWSLATEEQFYLVWPPVVALCLGRRAWAPVAFMAAVLAAHLAAVGLVGAGAWDGAWFPARVLLGIAPAICLGCLLAILLHSPAGFRLARPVIGHAWSSLALLALLLAAVAWEPTPRVAIDGLMALLVASACIRPRQWLSPVLANPVVRYVGAISYGMYLLHMLGMQVARMVVARTGGGRPATFALAVAFAVGLASASYWTFERRLLALKNRFRDRPDPRTPAEPIASPALSPAAP